MKIVKKIYHTFDNVIKKIFSLLFYMMPIKSDRIVFINFSGKGFGCNPRYIAEELLRRDNKYDMVWFVRNKQEELPSKIRRVKVNTIRALYELYTSHIIVTNVTNGFDIKKKETQYIIQTWHGSFGLKKIEGDAKDKLDPKYVALSRKNTDKTDLFLSNSKFQTNEYRRSFLYNGEIYEYGHPRNDILFKDKEQVINKVKKYFGLNDEKIILYAPTFRDNSKNEVCIFDFDRLLKLLNQKGNYKLLIRMHPNVTNYKHIYNFNDSVLDATTYPDIQELLIYADALITDYSSSMLDFMLLRKKIFLYTPDIDEYGKGRGLNDCFFDLPFKFCKDENELIEEVVNNIDIEKDNKIESFMKEYKSFDSGIASKMVANRIEAVIKENK